MTAHENQFCIWLVEPFERKDNEDKPRQECENVCKVGGTKVIFSAHFFSYYAIALIPIKFSRSWRGDCTLCPHLSRASGARNI